jgi:glutaminyl-tRNA synthetase
MMSKRRLLALVAEGHVSGWDDPRMPTLAGLRRRGVRPSAIREFAERVGVARADNLVRIELLEAAIRDDLEPVAPRALCVLDPLPVELVDREDGIAHWEAPWFPDGRAGGGGRLLPFGRHLLIERDDFREAPEPGYKRLVPGGAVRLRHGPVLRCVDVVRDADGAVVGLKATADEATRGAPSEVKATIHWVARDAAVRIHVRVWGHLFRVERPDAEEDFRKALDPESRRDVVGWGEPSLATFGPGQPVQFERLGFFSPDPVDSRPGAPVFNRVVALRDATVRKAAVAPAHGEPMAAPPERAGDPAAAPFVARGVGEEEARVLAHDEALTALFEAALAGRTDAKSLAAFLVHAVRPALRDGARPDAARVARIADRLAAGVIASRGADALLRSTGDVDADIEAFGLRLDQDEEAIRALVAASEAAAPDKAAALRAGRTGLHGFFVGDVLRRSARRADPTAVDRLVRELIG